jgi:hypothetical protein
MSLTPDQRVHTALAKIRWEKELSRYGYERNRMSPELAEALRNEIRTALEAGGGSFDINVARRVYDLAIAARDMCIAATGSVKEAIDQIKDTNGPMETLDAADTPESQMQASESFGARLLRELMATLPMLQGARGEDPKRLVHALAEARRNGMHDVAEQLEVKLFGRTLSGSRPVIAEEIEVVEGSYEQGYADGRSGALPMSSESAYHEGFLKGTEARLLAKEPLAGTGGERSNGAADVKVSCDHPTEALREGAYDDGYQVFCGVCGKHVRLGRLSAPQPAQGVDGVVSTETQDEGHAGRRHARPPSGMENAFDGGQQ